MYCTEIERLRYCYSTRCNVQYRMTDCTVRADGCCKWVIYVCQLMGVCSRVCVFPQSAQVWRLIIYL